MPLTLGLAGSTCAPGAAGPTVDVDRLTPPQARLVLAYLVVARHRRVPRAEVADLLWPDLRPPSWDAALRGLVARIRVFLGSHGIPGSVLVTERGCYRLTLPVGTAVDLEHAARALDLATEALDDGLPAAALPHAYYGGVVYGGPLLPSLDHPWVVRQRALHRDGLVRSLELTSRARAMLGRHADSVAAAREAHRLCPLRESALRALMAAHRGSGNRAEALDAYHHGRQRIRRELGIEPSAQTERLFLEILREDADVPPALALPAVNLTASQELRGLGAELAVGTGAPPSRERARALTRLCALARQAGSAEEAEAAGSEAAAISRILGDPDLLADAALANATYDRLGPHARGSGLGLVEEALAALDDPARPDPGADPDAGADPGADPVADPGADPVADPGRRERRVALLCRRVQYLAGAHQGSAALCGAAELAGLAGPDAPPWIRAWALAADLYARPARGVDVHRRRADTALELFEFGRVESVEFALLGLEARAEAVAAAGDLDAAYALTAGYARLAEREGVPWARLQVALHRAFRSAAEGRFGECEQLAVEVGLLGARVGPPTVIDAMRLACVYVPRWMTCRAEELLVPMQEVARWLDAPEPAAAVAFLLATSGRQRSARVALERLMSDPGPAGLEPGNLRDLSLFNLVGACVRLGDRDAAAELAATLAPVADTVCLYPGRIFLGSFHFHLGRLALTRGRRDEAVHHLEIALERHRRLRVTPWVALAAHALAAALTQGPRPGPSTRAADLRAEAAGTAQRVGMCPPAAVLDGAGEPRGVTSRYGQARTV